ncbi:MAG TPA: hypothetical protein VMY38_04690 [Gemmatimonadaceae bacterium]|nr:hypothetical protein [Gemmatimonadaceae bacterium]
MAETGSTITGYDSLRSGAMLLDRSDRGRWRFTGPKAAETLTGLVTNDVLALRQGDGLYCAALTPKGKIVADLRILLESEEEFFVDTGAASAPGWRAMARKFINPRVAPFSETTDRTADVGVFGAGAAELLARAVGDGGCALEQLRPYSHVHATLKNGVEVLVVRAADLGEVPAFDVISPKDSSDQLRELLTSLGVVSGTRNAYDVARIEAGVPEWGVDMNEDTLPQEANFDELGAISYSKGCYVGQEVVARIHFRGHVNKNLRRVAFGAEQVPARGAELVDAAGKTVGDVRSAAVSPRAGGVGIAMVRREIAVGAQVTARGSAGSAQVTVL